MQALSYAFILDWVTYSNLITTCCQDYLGIASENKQSTIDRLS